jgi:hypothetical protein
MDTQSVFEHAIKLEHAEWDEYALLAPEHPSDAEDDMDAERERFETTLRSSRHHAENQPTDKRHTFRFHETAGILKVQFQSIADGIKTIGICVENPQTLTDVDKRALLSARITVMIKHTIFTSMSVAAALLQSTMKRHAIHTSDERLDIPVCIFNEVSKYGLSMVTDLITVGLSIPAHFPPNQLRCYVISTTIPNSEREMDVTTWHVFLMGRTLNKSMFCFCPVFILVCAIAIDDPIQPEIDTISIQVDTADDEIHAPWIVSADDCNIVELLGVVFYCVPLHPDFRSWDSVLQIYNGKRPGVSCGMPMSMSIHVDVSSRCSSSRSRNGQQNIISEGMFFNIASNNGGSFSAIFR